MLNNKERPGYMFNPHMAFATENPAKITPTGLNSAIRASRGEIIVRLNLN